MTGSDLTGEAMEKEIEKRIALLVRKLKNPRGGFEAMHADVNEGYSLGAEAQIKSEIRFLKSLQHLAGFVRSLERVLS